MWASLAGGTLVLDTAAAVNAVATGVGSALDLDPRMAAFGISEIVDENMAAATRSHAVEWGKDVQHRTLIAFGGAAPLHAARMADKLGIDQIIVPTAAGVGSAIGFLIAPVAYEVVRSRHMRLGEFDQSVVNGLMEEMLAEARAVVQPGASGQRLVESRRAFMRYLGQGYEIAVPLPSGPLQGGSAELKDAFDQAYGNLYGRTIPNLDVEILSWTLTLATEMEAPTETAAFPAAIAATTTVTGRVLDPDLDRVVEVPVFAREDLKPGCEFGGPALVAEDQTTTVVTAAFSARVNSLGHLVLARRELS